MRRQEDSAGPGNRARRGRRQGRDRLERVPRPLRALGALVLLIGVAAAIAYGLLVVTGALDDAGVDEEQVFEIALDPESGDDPFAWARERERELIRRATVGNSHVLYAKSPAGALATARRISRFRTEIERAASEHDVSPELMEAMVFLESAGRTDVIAGGTDPAGASGIAQIVAGTATDLLGMRVDLVRSRELTARINNSLIRAERLRERVRKLQGKKRERKQLRRLLREVQRLERVAARSRRDRTRVDERFDPVAALDGMGTYLEIANERFGREDLAVTSYHMGIGNLSDVVRAFAASADPELSARELVALDDLAYAQIYFDSSPIRNSDAHETLAGFSDDSSTYFWRVLAAREIIRLYRSDRDELRRLEALYTAKATAEEVFHPESETRVFDDASELRDGIDAGELSSIPAGRKLGFEVGKQLGELAGELGVERKLYKAMRPEALAALAYISGRVQAISGKRGQKLTVTSAVRDRAYQQALVGRNSQATRRYSLHTTGYSFDILRRYESKKQARAFQFALDRLSDLAVIDYAVEPEAIHVTVSPLVKPLLD